MRYLNWQTKKKTNSTGKVVLGTVLGMAAGLAAGMLTAPRSGRETRGLLSERTNETLGKVSNTIAENTRKAEETGRENVDKIADKLG